MTCGIVGVGSFFQYAYLPALNRKDSPLVVTGVMARDKDKFAEVQHGLRYTTKHFTEYDTLLASGIDCVLILLPNHLHGEYVHRALEKGLHVFCEKPLVQNITEARTLQAVAEKSGRVLMVDFNERYLDRNRVLKKILLEGRLGKITSAHAFHNQDLRGLPTFAAMHRDMTGGGVMHNAGIHFVNLFRHWFGKPERVRAVFENRALPAECGEDTAHCHFWFSNGLTATLEASLANAVDTTYERVELIGAEGKILSDLKKGDIRCHWQHGSTKRQLHIHCKREIISDSVSNALAAFARCIRDGSRPETDVEDFIETMKVIEAITLSAQRGAEVHMDEIERRYVR